jgi:hypothetical protein
MSISALFAAGCSGHRTLPAAALLLFALTASPLGFCLLGAEAATVPGAGSEYRAEPCQVVIYSARIDGAIDASDAELARIARESGSIERVAFAAVNGPAAINARRQVLRAGSAEHRYPGMSVDFRGLLQRGGGRFGSVVWGADGQSADLRAADGVSLLHWDLPRHPGDQALRVRITRDQELLATLRIRESARGPAAELWPDWVRIDVPGRGGSIVQIYDYNGSLPAELELEPGPFGKVVRGRSVPGVGMAVAPGGFVTTEDAGGVDTPAAAVDYHYALNDLTFDYDSGWQPPGNEEPGGWPMQMRFQFGGGFDIASNIDGAFHLRDEELTLGAGGGDLLADFGAEMEMQAALDLYIIDPIILPVPYVPRFDLRAYDDTTFDSFLLDSSVQIEDDGRGLLYAVPLAGIPWLFEGGVAGNAAVHMDGEMSADALTTEEGLRFETEAESGFVRAPGGSYHSSSEYLDNLDLDTQVWLYPTGFIRLFGFTWYYELPLGIEWVVTEGRFDMEMSPSSIDFDLRPGDLLWSFAAPAEIADPLRGVEGFGDHLWLTSGGPDNLLHEITRDGVWLRSFAAPAGSGWADLATDGDYLYATAASGIEQIDPLTGLATGWQLPSPVEMPLGLAYEPGADLFWCGNAAGELAAVDRGGVVQTEFGALGPLNALAWDNADADTSWLWVAATDDSLLRQFDPRQGFFTGRSFNVGLGGLAGGGFDRGRGTWLGATVAQPATLLGLKLNDGFQPDTVYVQILQTRVDRPYVMPGQSLGMDLQWRYEDTIAPDSAAVLLIEAQMGEDLGSGIDPWQVIVDTVRNVAPGIYTSHFQFTLSHEAPVGVSGRAGAMLERQDWPEVTDSLYEGTFMVGINPEAGSIAGVVLNRATGEGVGGMRVELRHADGDPSGIWTNVREAGDFELDAVDPGDYYLELSHDWYAPLREPPVGSFAVEPYAAVDRDTLEATEEGMAYIEIRPESPSRYEVIYFPESLNVRTSFTPNCEYRWVKGLKGEPVEGYFFAFEDESLGTEPGYMRIWFDLPTATTPSAMGLEWRGIGKKTLRDNIYAYYKVNDTPIWRGTDRYIYDTSWLDYGHVAGNALLLNGRNKLRLGATNDTDWSEHIIDTMRWSFYGWHPEAAAPVSSHQAME